MQHGFWEEFRAAHFLKVREMRNLIGHTDSRYRSVESWYRNRIQESVGTLRSTKLSSDVRV